MAHVTFVHGIANKPAPHVLERLWVQALAVDDGLSLVTKGATYEMVYWADVLYERPLEEGAVQESLEAVDATSPAAAVPMDLDWRQGLVGTERALVEALVKRLNLDSMSPEAEGGEPGALEGSWERVPLPGWLKRDLMGMLLRDVHHYLFNVEHRPRAGATYRVQDEIRRRLVEALRRGGNRVGPHVLVSHSMGTVIAYDCLKRVAGCPRVDALMTIGSPLGLDEIQDGLRPDPHNSEGWSRHDGYPRSRLGGRWVNVYDRLDPVAGFDPVLANDYRREGSAVVEDVNEQNYGRWRHDISKYLGGAQLREHLATLLR